MNRFYSISKAATELGVSISTLRRWESEGKLVPQRTKGNQRRYSAEQIMGLVRKVTPKPDRITLAYARVSSADQKKDLERQKPFWKCTVPRKVGISSSSAILAVE